jgi:hypothetical protein
MIAMMPHPPCPGRCHSCIPAWLQRRLAPLTTISTCRLPQREQTSRRDPEERSQPLSPIPPPDGQSPSYT